MSLIPSTKQEELPKQAKIECEKAPKVDRFIPRMVVFHEAWTKNKVHVLGLTPSDYADMSVMVADMHKALKQQRARSEYYEGCIKEYNSQIGGH